MQLGLPDAALDALRLQVGFALTRAAAHEAAEAKFILAELEARAAAGELAPEHAAALEQLRALAARRSAPPPTAGARPLSVAGASLPASSQQTQRLSLLTHARIRGPVVVLEDGASCLSQSEALMWAKLHPFSPLNSGQILNPF